MEFKVDLNHQELASAIAGEVLKVLKPLLEKRITGKIQFSMLKVQPIIYGSLSLGFIIKTRSKNCRTLRPGSIAVFGKKILING